MSEAKSKAERIQAIKRGEGIQHLLDRGYEILGYPLLIHDMDYKLIARSRGVTTDDPIWEEFMRCGKLGESTLEMIKNEGFIDHVAYSADHSGVTYLTSERYQYDRLFCQLYNKDHMPIADLIAIACETPFEDDTPSLFMQFRGILSKEMEKDPFFQDYGQTYQERVVKWLIEGKIEDKELYTGHVANIDAGLKTNIFLGAVDLTECDPARATLAFFKDLLRRAAPACKCYRYENWIIALLSAEEQSLSERQIEKLRRLLRQEALYIGISSAFENLFELSKYFHEAVDALRRGRERDVRPHIVMSEKKPGHEE